mgnify:CR=1 FL=1
MYNYNINHTANKKMIKRYITLIYCSVTLWGLFTIPVEVSAQEQTMTREERIKALEHKGFCLSEESVIGHDGTKYNSYYFREV